MNSIVSLYQRTEKPISRRSWLRAAGCGFGYLSLSALLADEFKALAAGSDNPLAPRPPHFEPKAKRVIFLFMHGGPSSIDTFDPKERLVRDHGKPLPIKRPLAFADGPVGPLMKPLWEFKPGGKSGIPVSDLFPHMRECVDDLCVIRSMVGEGVDHGGAKNWSSAFLPGVYQGTAIGNSGLKVDDIKNEPIEYLLGKQLSPDEQRYELEMLRNINNRHKALRKQDAQLEARIQAFELAFRMQSQAPEAFQVEKESEATKKLYGLDDPITQDFAWQCILARRLAERDVRYIQCTHSYKWDQHSDLYNLHTKNAREVDKPIAGLLKDLKARGLLKDTLVIWAGEFGRTPVSESGDGRDHNPYGYSIWVAGGGVKAGFVYGATDDIGYHAVEDRMHIHDFHATVLRLLGLDHERLTYRYSGRDFRLTDVAGVVARNVIA